MDVDIDQARPTLGMLDMEAELFDSLTQRRLGRGLTGVDVASWLHPAGETLVEMEDRAPGAHDYRRSRHMGGVGVLVVRFIQAPELGQEAFFRLNLAPRGGLMLGHDCPYVHSRRDHASHIYHRWPVKTVTAFPAMRTRGPSGRTKSTAPLGES